MPLLLGLLLHGPAAFVRWHPHLLLMQVWVTGHPRLPLLHLRPSVQPLLLLLVMVLLVLTLPAALLPPPLLLRRLLCWRLFPAPAAARATAPTTLHAAASAAACRPWERLHLGRRQEHLSQPATANRQHNQGTTAPHARGGVELSWRAVLLAWQPEYATTDPAQS
jgi:hypothetical protein